MDLGRATGARLVLYGSLIGAGSDSVRLVAAVLDVATEALLAEFEFRDEAERVDRLADSLTLRVIRELGRSRPGGRERLSAMGTTSLPAIKAFLNGERHYRRSEWDSAHAYYERAVASDSAFALALNRLSHTVQWRSDWFSVDPAAYAYAMQAGAFNRGLPPRESLLVAADSVSASMLSIGWIGDGWQREAGR